MATAIRFITRVQDTDDFATLDAVQFVAMAATGYFSNERVLTGTANQITLTDGGAGGAATLSTPQDIHTAATPEFAGLGIGGAGVAARVTVPEVRALDANGLKLYEDGGTGIFVKDGGNVGIGIMNPQAVLDVNTGKEFLANFESLDNRGYIRIADNDSIGIIGAEDGKMYFGVAGAAIPSAATIVLTGARSVGIGTPTPGARLHVDQSSTTGAKPVITLDQADIDQVLAKIIATAAAASVDRTLVAASDFGTPGALTGWIQVEIQDDGDRIADGDYYIPLYAAPS